MKQSIIFIGLIIMTLLQSCRLENQHNKVTDAKHTEKELFDKYSNDSIRSVIFKIAYNNTSTAPNYIVFKAKDLNTELVKEICCEAPFLSGAMHQELDIKYDTKGTEYIDSIILSSYDSIFEFRNIEALNNISFKNYPNYDRIIQISNDLDLDYYSMKFGRNDSSELMYFETDTGFVQTTFTHIMFKCGILTRRDCEAGNNIWFGN